MNRGLLLFLAILVLGLGCFYFFYDVKGKPEREKAETQSKRFFPELKGDQLVSVHIEQLKDVGKVKAYKRLLVKKHGLWVLDDPKEPKVLGNLMVGTATRNLVELQRADDLGASATPDIVLKPAEFGLDKPSYSIELKSSDGHSYVLNLGSKTPEGKGFYAQTPGGPIAALNTTLPELLEVPEDKLRDNSPLPFLTSKVTKLAVTLEDKTKIAVEISKPREKSKDEVPADDNMNIEITDLNEEWKMTSPEVGAADPQKVRDLLYTWKAVKFGRFLKPEEKIDFSKPALRFESTVEGEAEPYVFEVGPVVPAKPNMRYVRRLNPDETMVVEINNPKLMDISVSTLQQKHLAAFEPSAIKRIDAKINDVKIVGKRSDHDWTLTQPQPGNPNVASRTAAVDDLLFELKSMEWKSKSSETAFTESSSFQIFDKDDKSLLKLTLGQESGKGRLAKVEGSPNVYVIEPDPTVKLTSIAARIKEEIAPTPMDYATPGAPTPGGPPQQAPQILIQNGTPMAPVASSTPVRITIPASALTPKAK